MLPGLLALILHQAFFTLNELICTLILVLLLVFTEDLHIALVTINLLHRTVEGVCSLVLA